MTQTIQPAPIRKSLTVAVSPQKAALGDAGDHRLGERDLRQQDQHQVFTDGFDRWWPKSHTISKAPLARAVIEPREGGRWYGIDETGHEDDWGEVLAWEPPGRLLLSWRINGDFTYDPEVFTEVDVRFTETPEGHTHVAFEHRGLETLGASAEQGRARMDSPGGWGGILAGFKQAAES